MVRGTPALCFATSAGTVDDTAPSLAMRPRSSHSPASPACGQLGDEAWLPAQVGVYQARRDGADLPPEQGAPARALGAPRLWSDAGPASAGGPAQRVEDLPHVPPGRTGHAAAAGGVPGGQAVRPAVARAVREHSRAGAESLPVSAPQPTDSLGALEFFTPMLRRDELGCLFNGPPPPSHARLPAERRAS